MIKVGVIGYGYWGPNLVRNFHIQSDASVKWVSDLRAPRLDTVKKNYPAIQVSSDYHDILNDPEIEAAVIAAPVHLHFAIAKEAILKGKHVLIEKPMTSSSSEAEELIELASKHAKVLMVDHTFLYTGAIHKIKSIIDTDGIGDLRYFDSTRINLGLFQADINVLWDLLPHDLSMLDYLVKERPIAVSATGISHTKNKLENMAYMTVFYPNDFIAHFSCSWTSPVKIRKILIGGSKKMIMFDDVEPTEKVKVYDTSYSVKTDEERHKMLVDYRVGDIYIPKIEQREALDAVAQDFLSAIRTGSTPIANSAHGLQVIKILEAADRSMKENGKEVKLN